MSTTPDPTLTRSRELHQAITTLAGAAVQDSPFVSCYLDLTAEAPDPREFLDRRSGELRRTLDAPARAGIERALRLVDASLGAGSHREAQGMAMFARSDDGGDFALAMAFAVPVRHRLSIFSAPDIFPLLELRDTYERHMLVFVQPELLQVVEVDLGVASTRAWAGGPGAGRQHDSRHGAYWPGRDDGGNSLRPLRPGLHVPLLERLMPSGGRAPLILAGDAELVGELRNALPPALLGRLAGTLPLPATATFRDAVAASMRLFVELEERESRAVAAAVVRGANSRGLALTGGTATLQALREGRADTLVMVGIPDPEPGRRPGDRWAADLPDLRAELSLLAAQQGLAVEVVDNADDLLRLGGVGCLLGLQGQTAAARGGCGPLRLAA